MPLICLAILDWGEARGEPIPGKEAVAYTVKNRLKLAPHYGTDWRSVIFKPAAYSCFLGGDINRTKLLRPLQWGLPAEWVACYTAAFRVFNGLGEDATQGSTHYHAAYLYPDHLPAWAHAPNVHRTVTIGKHMFYREEWPGHA